MVDDDNGFKWQSWFERKADGGFKLGIQDWFGDFSGSTHQIWLVSAHVTRFGKGKPRVEVGHATCKKIILFYFSVNHICFFRLLAESKDLNVMRLGTKSCEIKI